MPELQLVGIAAAPVVVALVGMAKALGMDTKYAPWVNGGLSMAFYGLMILTQLVPGSVTALTYGLNALVIFLAAAGFYDRYQSVKKLAYAG
jgi:hypothetical protein